MDLIDEYYKADQGVTYTAQSNVSRDCNVTISESKDGLLRISGRGTDIDRATKQMKKKYNISLRYKALKSSGISEYRDDDSPMSAKVFLFSVSESTFALMNYFFRQDLSILNQKGLLIENEGDRFKLYSKIKASERELRSQTDEIRDVVRNLEKGHVYITCFTIEEDLIRKIKDNCMRKFSQVYVVYKDFSFKLFAKTKTSINAAKEFIELEVETLDKTESRYSSAKYLSTSSVVTSVVQQSDITVPRALRDSSDIEGNEDFQKSYPDYSRSQRDLSSHTKPRASNTSLYFEFQIRKCIIVKVYQGSLLTAQVDAIVNAANEFLKHYGGVAATISQNCGPELNTESNLIVKAAGGSLHVTEIAWTTAGDLKCFKGVLHAVGPRWDRYNDEVQCLEDLQHTIQKILESAEERKCRSIGMPAISSGIFGVPQILCAAMYLYGIFRFSERNRTTMYLKEIHIVDTNPSILADIQNMYTDFIKGKDDYISLKPKSVITRYPEYVKRSLNRSRATSPTARDTELTNNHRSRTENAKSEPNDFVVQQHPDGKISGVTTPIKVFELPNGLLVKMYTGSLVRFKGSAIVCSADTCISGIGPLADAVKRAGGKEYEKSFSEMKQKIGLTHKPGDIFHCKAGDMKVERVFHCVIDSLYITMSSSMNDYEHTLQKILLALTNKRDVTHIAMPLLGAGSLIKREELDSCCSSLFKTLKKLCNASCLCKLKELHLINKNPAVTPQLVKEFKKYAIRKDFTSQGSRLGRSFSHDGTEAPSYKPQDSTFDKPPFSRSFSHNSDNNRSKYSKGNTETEQHKQDNSDRLHTSSAFRHHQPSSAVDDVGSKSVSNAYHEKGARPKQYRHVTTVTSGDSQEHKEDIDTLLSSISTSCSLKISKEKSVNAKPKGNLVIINDDSDNLDEETYVKVIGISKDCEYCGFNRNLSHRPCGHVCCKGCRDQMIGCSDCILCPNPSLKVEDTCAASEPPKCVICMDDVENVTQLKCGHEFCHDCIKSALCHKPVCPVCGTMYGSVKGNQPENGKMEYYTESSSLPGYEDSGTIVIHYKFPEGIQGPCHSNPGKPYKGTQRKAYLPDCREGRMVLKLLEKAFKQRLTFTIGSSRTTGQEDVVTWNDIHHKTMRNSGAQRFGYPDPTYLQRVQEELAAKGLTE